jgi:hypothetical protein
MKIVMTKGLVMYVTGPRNIAKSTTFPYDDVGLHKSTWTLPDWKTHSHINLALADVKRR